MEKDRPVTKDEVRAGERRLFAYLAERIQVQSRDQPCPPTPGAVRFVDKADGFLVAAELTFTCPRLIDQAAVRYDLFFDLDPRHQGLARLAFGDDDGREQVFRADHRTLAVRRDLGLLDHVADYLHLGIEHIFTGYDHIAFIFGLLVIAAAAGLRAGGRRILAVVTAFTVAHSVTLIASALGLVSLPSAVVEPAIALSIAYVGVENLLGPAPRHRFALTFLFGLIHGFGFASVLREIGLPERGLLVCLVSFNLGVELGQLAVVAAVLPLLALIGRRPELTRRWHLALAAVGAACTYALFRRFGVADPHLAVVVFAGAPLLFLLGRRYGYDRVVRRGGSAVIALLALLWFVERVLGRELLGGALG